MSDLSPPAEQGEAEPVAALERASRTYRTRRSTVTAVDAVSLSVYAGEIVGVSGPSGCGKSTLLRLLAGLERPDRGELQFAGRPAWPRRVGSPNYPCPGYVMPVFQDPYASVDPRWPIWKTITEPLTVPRRRLPAQERRHEATIWLERAGLGHLSPDARPAELSGGQCQRVALVRAMVAEPALIVADEPTARQDVITAAAMTRLLQDAAEGGVALVVVSHDETWLDLLAHRVCRLGAR